MNLKREAYVRRIALGAESVMFAAVLGPLPGIASQAALRPLTVFILAGQSNMQGQGLGQRR